MKISANGIVLKLLGLLLLVGAGLKGNEGLFQISLITVPPYGQALITESTYCVLGKMDESKEWFATTPATALITDGRVRRAWEEEAPGFETIMQNMATAMSSNMRKKH